MLTNTAPPYSVRPEAVEGWKLRTLIDRAKHPSTPLRANGDCTHQTHRYDVDGRYSQTSSWWVKE